MLTREGGWTDRMHTWQKIRPYRVDSHSWGMAVLLHQMFPEDCEKDLLLAILYHDVPERWVGDTPYGAKYILNPDLGQELKKTERRVSEALKINFQLNQRAKSILGFLDVLEFTLWVREEIALGNSTLQKKLADCFQTLQKMPLWEEAGQLVMEMVSVPMGYEELVYVSE